MKPSIITSIIERITFFFKKRQKIIPDYSILPTDSDMKEVVNDAMLSNLLNDSTMQEIISESVNASNIETESSIKSEDILTTTVNDNPLEPFYKPYFTIYPYNRDRFITKEKYEEVFKSHINSVSFMSETKAPILKKMWEDAFFIYKTLEPLDKLGILYTIDLTGGCVRDFVLNKHQHIKDLDVMISLQDFPYITSDNLLADNLFSQDELDSVNWKDNDNKSEKKYKLVNMCFERTNDIAQVFYFNDKDREEIIGSKIYDGVVQDVFGVDRLITVIKTNGNHTHYPIDLLVTDWAKPAFLNSFDFDICKASFCIVNKVYNKKFPEDYSHLISRFSADINFWADVANRKITYNCDRRSMRQIEKSFTDHLDRIIVKYPEYTLLITSPNSAFYDYAMKFHFERKLREQLKPRHDDIKRHKI